jgi:hypothetical protein
MLTNLGSESLVKLGSRLQVVPLIAQAQVTIDIATGDQPVFKALGAPFFAEARSALERLRAALDDRSVADQVAQAATVRQNGHVPAAKAWRREFVNRVRVALLRGVDVPAGAARVGRRGGGLQSLVADLRMRVELGSQFVEKLAPFGVTPELLKQGSDVAQALAEADDRQEAHLRAVLPDSVRRLWALAAVVYLALRQVNAMGRAVHARDRASARKYVLSILHPRDGTAGKPAA